MSFKITMKPQAKALVAKQQKAWAKVNEVDLPQAFNYALDAPIWQWNGTTQRQNGSTASTPRSVSDTGELASSYHRERNGKNTYVHGWDAEYALVNHEGGVRRDGYVHAARPWSEEGVKVLPELFVKAYREP